MEVLIGKSQPEMEVFQSWQNPQALFLTSRALHFPTAAASAAPQRPAAPPTRRATRPTSPGHAASAAAAAGASHNGLASEKWHQEGPKDPTAPTMAPLVPSKFWFCSELCTVQAFGFSNRREIGRQIWGKCGSFTKKTKKVLALVSHNLRARNDLRIHGIFFYNCAMIYRTCLCR